MKPLVAMGKPFEIEKYSLLDIEGINVYLMNGLTANNDTVEVSTASFLFMENLVVSGLIV